MKKQSKAARMESIGYMLQYGLITTKEDFLATMSGEYTVKKWVRSSKLAKKMYPDFLEEKDDMILIDTGIEKEPVILILSPGFIYTGTPKK